MDVSGSARRIKIYRARWSAIRHALLKTLFRPNLDNS